MVRDPARGFPLCGRAEGAGFVLKRRALRSSTGHRRAGHPDSQPAGPDRPPRLGFGPHGPNEAKGPVVCGARGPPGPIRNTLIWNTSKPRPTRQLRTGTDGYFGKVGRWLREGF